MNQIRHRLKAIGRRSAAAFCAACFLFFLISSAPHRVHHFFEQVGAGGEQAGDHDHAPADQHKRRSNDSNCVFQISASRCHLGLAWQTSAEPPPLRIAALDFSGDLGRAGDFRPAVFHIRAPPLA